MTKGLASQGPIKKKIKNQENKASLEKYLISNGTFPSLYEDVFLCRDCVISPSDNDMIFNERSGKNDPTPSELW